MIDDERRCTCVQILLLGRQLWQGLIVKQRYEYMCGLTIEGRTSLD